MNLIKRVQHSTTYINYHASHYRAIFELYVEAQTDNGDANRARKLFSDFIKLFIKLQMFANHKKLEKIKGLLENLSSCRIIFKQILRTLTLEEHQKVDAMTMVVYMKSISKMLKDLQTSECGDDNQLAVPKLNTKVKSFTKLKSITKLKSSKRLRHNSDDESKTCSTSLDILRENKKLVIPILKEMKNIAHLFDMLSVVLSEMQREYLQKINCYNLYDPTAEVNNTDIEYHNKLIDTSYKQILSFLTSEGSVGSIIFDDSSDTQDINVFFDDNTTFTICTIDNFRVRSEEVSGTETVILDVGTESYSAKHLREGADNETVIEIMKDNFAAIKSAMYAISTNKNVLIHWLKVIRKNLRC